MVMVVCAGCKKEEPAQVEGIQKENQEEVHDKNEAVEKKEKEETIAVVYVCGAVITPGVYELPKDARIYEAIKAAGGLSQDADLVQINQAEVVTDGQRIYIPTIEEASEMPAVGQEAQGTDNKVNLNTASLEELMTLPGIGEAKATSIIKYREQQGKFQTIEDIKQITGIKDGVYNKISDKIKV